MEKYSDNKALQSAYEKGYRAGLNGDYSGNPYPDTKNYRGGVTFSRAFRRAWYAGQESGSSERLKSEDK